MPAEIILATKFALFGDELAQKGAPDMPETDDGEVVGRNERSPFAGARIELFSNARPTGLILAGCTKRAAGLRSPVPPVSAWQIILPLRR